MTKPPPKRMGLADIEFRIYEHGVMNAGALEHRELCQAMMNRIVAVFNRICKRRRTKVMSMQEFYPRSAVLHGLNHNRGALIEIRFRAPENKNSVLEFPHIVKTAAHELAHNWIGAHNASFWKLYDEILAEAEQVLDDMTSAGIAEQRRRGVNVMDMNSLGMTGGGSPNGFDDRKYGGELTLGDGGGGGSDPKGAPGAEGAGAAFAGTGHVVGGVGNTVGTAGKAAIAAMPGKGNRLGGGGGDDTEAVIRAARLARLGGPAAQQQGPTADEEMRRLRLRGWLRRLGLEERDAVVREQQRRREQMLLAARGRSGGGGGGGDAVTLTAQEEADIEEYHPTCGVRHGQVGGNEDGDGCCGGDAAPQRAKSQDNAGSDLAPPPPRPPAPEQQQQQQERPRQDPPPLRSKAMSSASAAAAAAAEGRRQRQREEQAAMNPPEDTPAKHCECLGASAGWHKPGCPLK